MRSGDRGKDKELKEKMARSAKTMEQIERLGELRAKGLLTDEEFQRKKAELLR
jgi:hypothetical protein